MADGEIYEREVVHDDRRGRGRSSGPIIAVIVVLVVGLILAIVLLGGDDSSDDGGGVDVEDIEVDIGDDG